MASPITLMQDWHL